MADHHPGVPRSRRHVHPDAVRDALTTAEQLWCTVRRYRRYLSAAQLRLDAALSADREADHPVDRANPGYDGDLDLEWLEVIDAVGDATRWECRLAAAAQHAEELDQLATSLHRQASADEASR